MKKTINISTGEVKMGESDSILVSNGIGSCIVIAGINIKKNIGAMAHFMLPGRAPENEIMCKTKYAQDALDKLLNLLQIETDDTSDIRTCLVGAGNVLKKKNDTVCKNNIDSILDILHRHHIKIDAKSLGGIYRRTMHFDIQKREVYMTEGESKLELLKRW